MTTFLVQLLAYSTGTNYCHRFKSVDDRRHEEDPNGKIVGAAETTLYCSLSTKCEQESGFTYHFGHRWKTKYDFNESQRKITVDHICYRPASELSRKVHQVKLKKPHNKLQYPKTAHSSNGTIIAVLQFAPSEHDLSYLSKHVNSNNIHDWPLRSMHVRENHEKTLPAWWLKHFYSSHLISNVDWVHHTPIELRVPRALTADASHCSKLRHHMSVILRRFSERGTGNIWTGYPIIASREFTFVPTWRWPYFLQRVTCPVSFSGQGSLWQVL